MLYYIQYEYSGFTMSNNTVSQVSVQEYVERLQGGECGYSEEGLRSLDWCGQDVQGCNLSELDLHGLDMTGAKLRKANLSGADLRGANLCGANLSGAYLWMANLVGADLMGADLMGADLRKANLSKANLPDADLMGADLRGANLSKANLRDADLRGAKLRDADLSEANLRDADLRDADLSGANLRGAVLNWDQIPLVVNIDATILSAIEGDETLDMADWHTCDTTHCRAGWAVVLAGKEGRKLEEQLGTNAAAALIYTKSGSHPVPNWYADNKTALEEIKARAEHQLAVSQLISLEAKGIEIG